MKKKIAEDLLLRTSRCPSHAAMPRPRHRLWVRAASVLPDAFSRSTGQYYCRCNALRLAIITEPISGM